MCSAFHTVVAIFSQHRDGDGVIWPWDTFVGFRRLGFNFLISAAAPFFIHASFSYPTLVRCVW
jgi:hypothetical protein